MASRQWYAAIGDQQTGPHSDERLRELIAAGTVTANTQVWCEGMSTWARAADVPGLMASAPRPSSLPPTAAPTAYSGQASSEQRLAINVRVWPLFWRSLVVGISELAVIPLPWMATIFLRWFVDQVELPRQQRVGFAGKPEDIWWAFILYALCAVAGVAHAAVQLVAIPLSAFLILVITRWFFANLVWEGQTAPLRFTGGYWPLLGWTLLLPLSILSIVGWAWVSTAWARWMCRHVEGSHRELVFNASGWSYLWRMLVVVLTSIFLVPIPWTLRWFTRWAVSQLALVERA
jgi:hypothetical protein